MKDAMLARVAFSGAFYNSGRGWALGARPKAAYGMCGTCKHRRARRIVLRCRPAFATHHEINEQPANQCRQPMSSTNGRLH